MSEINPIGKVSVTPRPAAIQPHAEGPSFAQRLEDAVVDVNKRQNIADDAGEKLIKGEMGVHETMIAAQEADISLRMMLQVRGKALEAYKEVIRMQF